MDLWRDGLVVVLSDFCSNIFPALSQKSPTRTVLREAWAEAEVPRSKGGPEQAAMCSGWGLGQCPEEVTPKWQAGQEHVPSLQCRVARPTSAGDPEPT